MISNFSCGSDKILERSNLREESFIFGSVGGGEGVAAVELTTSPLYLPMMYHRSKSGVGTQVFLSVKALLNIKTDREGDAASADHPLGRPHQTSLGRSTRFSQSKTHNWFLRVWFQNKGGASREKRWGSSSC